MFEDKLAYFKKEIDSNEENNKEPFKEANRFFDKVLESRPDDLEVPYYKGIALERMYYYEKAISCYDKVIEDSPDYQDVWYRKGRCFADMQMYEDAIKCYDKANIDTEERHENLMCHKAISCRNNGRTEEAQEIIEKFIRPKQDYFLEKAIQFRHMRKYFKRVFFKK